MYPATSLARSDYSDRKVAELTYALKNHSILAEC
jgi:hypothetical protein